MKIDDRCGACIPLCFFLYKLTMFYTVDPFFFIDLHFNKISFNEFFYLHSYKCVRCCMPFSNAKFTIHVFFKFFIKSFD